MMLVVGGCPAAGGKGETFCVPTVLSCDTRGRPFIFSRPVYSARQTFGGFCKKSTYCNDEPACGNRQDTKRNATAKQMRGATGLTVLALLLALPEQRPACELASKCKKSANE